MRKSKRDNKKEKQPYTVQVEAQHEEEIRSYIQDVNSVTGMPIKRIATELLLEGKASKNFKNKIEKIKKLTIS